jgi:hypothetical protein
MFLSHDPVVALFNLSLRKCGKGEPGDMDKNATGVISV